MLAAFRRSFADFIVISTPERDIQYGTEHRGPSTNLCHIREWSLGELYSYLWASGFVVTEAGLTRGNDQGSAMATQLQIVVPA
jgi:hypothetical protein